LFKSSSSFFTSCSIFFNSFSFSFNSLFKADLVGDKISIGYSISSWSGVVSSVILEKSWSCKFIPSSFISDFDLFFFFRKPIFLLLFFVLTLLIFLFFFLFMFFFFIIFHLCVWWARWGRVMGELSEGEGGMTKMNSSFEKDGNEKNV
jgi:hypothetical protein